jgi:hypothetical protein
VGGATPGLAAPPIIDSGGNAGGDSSGIAGGDAGGDSSGDAGGDSSGDSGGGGSFAAAGETDCAAIALASKPASAKSVFRRRARRMINPPMPPASAAEGFHNSSEAEITGACEVIQTELSRELEIESLGHVERHAGERVGRDTVSNVVHARYW